MRPTDDFWEWIQDIKQDIKAAGMADTIKYFRIPRRVAKELVTRCEDMALRDEQAHKTRWECSECRHEFRRRRDEESRGCPWCARSRAFSDLESKYEAQTFLVKQLKLERPYHVRRMAKGGK